MDYKSIHLAWLKSHPQFVPRDSQSYTEPYYDIMKQIYSQPACSNHFALMMYREDIKFWEQCLAEHIVQYKEIKKQLKTEPNCHFVTVNFNHQTWSIDRCCKAITKLLEFDSIIKAKANFELFRDNGEHPHCHFLIYTHDTKGTVLYDWFRPGYIKEIVSQKNFIQIDPGEEHHLKYINLDKIPAKMVHVKKDIEWRKKNNIPDFEKNWN
jgi:hypothetical protein